MSDSERPVLVVGGAGYIGAHAVVDLAANGHKVVTYDNLVYGHREHVLVGEFEHGDLADAARLAEVFRRHRPKAVMHFAAYAYVGESVTDPAKYYRNNLGATLVLLDAMRAHGVDSLIFSSTCATYGEPQQIPIPETHPQSPINPYGWTKLMVERVLADYGRAYGLKSIAFRYFNAAGADPAGRIGERHAPETHLIPLVLKAIQTGRPIKVFGTDYPTPDGTCIRDYIHVTDLAQAHRLGLERLAAGGSGGAYNLGNGSGFSVKQVLASAERVTGKPVPFELAPRRAGDPGVLVGTSERARTELGWAPEYPGIDAMVEHAWHWHQKCPVP